MDKAFADENSPIIRIELDPSGGPSLISCVQSSPDDIKCTSCKQYYSQATFYRCIRRGKLTLFKMCEHCRARNRQAKRMRVEINEDKINDDKINDGEINNDEINNDENPPKRQKIETNINDRSVPDDIVMMQNNIKALRKNIERLESVVNDLDRRIMHRLQIVEKLIENQTCNSLLTGSLITDLSKRMKCVELAQERLNDNPLIRFDPDQFIN